VKTLSIIIPVYYNAESLPHLFEKLRSVESELKSRSVDLQLIFVDDGSGDDSLERLLEIKYQRTATTVLKLSRNFGAIQAIKAGLPYISGDCFTWIAADLQDPPSLIVSMVDAWLNGSKFVICTRAERDDPAVTRVWSSLFYVLVRRLVSPDYPHGGYDVALFDRQLLPYFVNSGKNINLALLAHSLGFSPTVIQYKRLARAHGKSRWTFGKKLKLLIDSLLGFSFLPIRLISLAGVVIAFFSMLYGVVVIVGVLVGGRAVPGFASLAALMAFLFGLVIVMLGILGEYLWRILDEINKRPESVVERVYQ
jgi:dolichol-phosphate mannosyltransferase